MAREYSLRFTVAMGDEDLDAPHPHCNPHDPLACTSFQLFPQAAPSQLPHPLLPLSPSPTTASLVSPRATASVPVGTYPHHQHHQHPQLAPAASPLAQLPYRFPFPAPPSLSPSPSSPSSSPSLPPYRHVLGRRQRDVEIRHQDKKLGDRMVRSRWNRPESGDGSEKGKRAKGQVGKMGREVGRRGRGTEGGADVATNRRRREWEDGTVSPTAIAERKPHAH